MAHRITKVAARAFCHPGKSGGGNPVTVFICKKNLPSHQRSLISQSCEWDSVIVSDNDNSIQPDSATTPSWKAETRGVGNVQQQHAYQSTPQFWFYKPSGEEVSFCAHSAIGACYAVIRNGDVLSSQSQSSATKDDDLKTKMSFLTSDGNRNDATVCGNKAEITMRNQLEESDLLRMNPNDQVTTTLGNIKDMNVKNATNEKIMTDIFSEIGLEDSDVMLASASPLPIFCNSSVARNKTLIPIASVERLHSATNPTNPLRFRDICDSIQSTGVYLYSPCSHDDVSSAAISKGIQSYECRQFPRASGYPEDPATGIAAAALASSLRRRRENMNERGSSTTTTSSSQGYAIYQGTAMGRPSKIGIRFLPNNGSVNHNEDREENDELLFCSGVVEVLSTSEISV